MLNKIIRTFSNYQTKLLINGKWVDASSGKTFPAINPATEEKLADVQQANAQDVDKAVQAARKAFDHGPWRRMYGEDRGALMYKLADLIEKHADELATLETLNNGKPISDSKNIDVPLSARVYRYYAGWADKIHGKVIPLKGPFTCYTRYEPVGVAGQIIPWNYPLLMQAWKLGPALAAGATIVMKPAEQTPLTALRFGELFLEAGFPEGVLNLLPGFGDAGQAIVRHNHVDKVAFTGSTEVGLEILGNSGMKNVKRVTLELGGKSPNIIFDDADFELAVEQANVALFSNMGQSCSAGTRVYVQEGIYDKFVQRMVEVAKNKVIGNPLDPNTNHGPQVDRTQMEKILHYIELGQKQGAKLLTGGKRWGNKGFFVEPTVFRDVTDDNVISKEEIFGPVMPILKFKTVDEVIERANKNVYGLAAGVVTKDVEKGLKVINALRAGTVYFNTYAIEETNTPFGGYKNSGIGRELADDGLFNYLEQKTVIIKQSTDTLP
jgi:aldehyde dehydrogenase (NAD+)